MTKSAGDVSVLAKDDLKATESICNLRPLGPPGSAAAPLSVPSRASSALPERIKKPAATSNSPRTPKNLALDGDKIKLMVPRPSSRSSNRDSSFQSRSLLF